MEGSHPAKRGRLVEASGEDAGKRLEWADQITKRSGDEGRIDHEGRQGSSFCREEEENTSLSVGTGGQKPDERQDSKPRADTRRQDTWE